MSLDLEDRLRAYRDTLDEAIAVGVEPTAAVDRGGAWGRLAGVAAGMVAVAGVAALTIAVDRRSEGPATGEPVLPMSSPAPSLSPTTTFDATTSTLVPPSTFPDPGPSPTDGMLPRFVVTDPRFVPVEVNETTGDVNPEEVSAQATYLTLTDDGTLQEITVAVWVGAVALDTDESNAVVRGRPAFVGVVAQPIGAEDAASVGWQETPEIAVRITMSPADETSAVRFANSLQVRDDLVWAALTEQVRTAPLPPEMQAWRDERVAAGFEPVEYGLAYG